jgi:hypothetical protein
MAPRFLIVAVTALALAPRGRAEEPSVGALVQTARFAPQSRAAELAIERLAQLGGSGWKALSALCGDPHPSLARAAAHALARCEGTESQALIWKAYSRADEESVRSVLAMGLARAYPEREKALLDRVRKELLGAPELLRTLSERGLPSEKLAPLLGVEGVAEMAHRLLCARGEPPPPDALRALGRVVARRGLVPQECRTYAARFAAAPDFDLLRAVAARLAPEEADDVRIGAHCLLCVISGIDQIADREVWRSWIATAEESYEAPPAYNKGVVAAAVARAVHHLRQDLLDDGLAIWPGWRSERQSRRRCSALTAPVTQACRPSRTASRPIPLHCWPWR